MQTAVEPLDSALRMKPVQASPDFSLVLGGPLFYLCRRIHLAGKALGLLHREVVAISLFAWLPLLLLSVIEGHAIGGSLKIPLLNDIEANFRFLVAFVLQ
jgi:hypothetical protein